MQFLLTILALSTPGSGSVFDPTTEPLVVPIVVLDASLTTLPLPKG
jgi:hypothetical protein